MVSQVSSNCQKIRSVHRKVCTGDMRDEIILQNRAITPVISSVDFVEDFVTNTTVFALVKTVKGDMAFDGIDTEVDVSHHFYIRFLSGITAETWISFQSTRFNILDVENLDNRQEFLLLRATDRGDDAKAASRA